MAVKVTSLKEWDVRKIIDDIGQPDIKAVIFFFSPSFEKFEPHTALCGAFPGADVFGASMCGGWSSNGAVQSGIAAMSLSSDEVDECYFSFQEGVKKDPRKSAHDAIDDLKRQTKGQKINSDEYLGLIFFDGLCLGELIMKEFTMEKDLNMAFVGGAAADEMSFVKTLVSAGDKISRDGLAAIILKMKIPFFFNHYVHYLPTEKSFTITRVEIMQRIAWEINGEPAADFYARQVGVNDVSMLTKEVFAKNPLGLILGDRIYIRSPNIVIDGKGLQFYCYIEAGTKVFLLKQGDIIANAHNSLAEAALFLPGIQGCLLFNCVQRHLELIERNLIDEYNAVFSKHPTIGFNTYGEELFTHHNQTLTAVFFGVLPEAGMTDPYKTKRLFHYTDSKLRSLVFDIVSRSELLSITISYLQKSIDTMNGDEEHADYESIRKSLDVMIEQSNISKEDIYRMLVVYQNNVEKTGEYVFNIVDEINAQNRRLVELREEAENANRTKSSFLASMSHEIRTPMNAITGMAELLLRSGLSDEARSYAQDIKQAGNNLISIINDILDFSKIEAGKMEIVKNNYLLASLINDTVNIIRTKLREKPIRFFTNIDGKIPHCLIGDEVRMRQVLLNLLSNAVKFTDKGFISLTITVHERNEDKVWLKFSIADTGKGIKPEDQKKLFGEFVQVDVKRNRNIEGTGLGLVITKRLCSIMDGSITMESQYGEGSTFTVVIPQGITPSEESESDFFASVDNAADKKVLVFERRMIYANSVCWSLENMNVPHEMAATFEDFEKSLFREEWTLILSGYGLHDIIRKIMNKPEKDYPGGKKPLLALMVEWGTEAYIPNVRFVSLPVQSLSIANILNGKADIKGYSDTSSVSSIIRYSFPRARMLVVDDISTNLKVAEGLLAPYCSVIDTCLSGAEAIELVKHINYDIVFMDHMMPDMDGIEATAIIREWEKEKRLKNENYKNIPIVALTANAVSGVREMFIEKGFNDFIAKPIDVSKLDESINRWISKDKRELGKTSASGKNNSGRSINIPKIYGIDVQKGISMTGGSEAGYYSVLAIFRKDAQNRLKILRKTIETEGMKSFIINVHALKSAAAAIGAQEVSEEAARLESAGRAGDEAYIHAHLDMFIGQLSKLIDGLTYALEAEKAENDIEKNSKAGNNDQIISLLKKLEEALVSQKAELIDNLIDDIYKQPLDEKTRESVDSISDDVLMTEFNKAIKTIKELMTNFT